MKEISENLLEQFSCMQTQTIESFKLKFDFLSDDSIKIKTKDKCSENVETEVTNKPDEQPIQTQTDEIEEIDLKKVESSRSGFWNRSLKFETKFDTFLNENQENQTSLYISKEDDEFIKDYIQADAYYPSVKQEIKSVEIKIDTNETKEKNLPLAINNESKSQTQNLVEKTQEAESESRLNPFTLYPGEIVEETDASSIETKITETKLDFYSVIKDDLESEYVVINNDIVEKFELNSNFNYSEHVYTPRYTFN